MIIKSLDHLRLISNKIADNVSEKDCIFLIGEIGVGKTTFTRNFINYLQKREGVKETEVLSPTFNLLTEYQINQMKINHYDLFRLKSAEELKNLDLFMDTANSITIIEWPQIIKEKPKNLIELDFKYEDDNKKRSVRIKGLKF